MHTGGTYSSYMNVCMYTTPDISLFSSLLSFSLSYLETCSILLHLLLFYLDECTKFCSIFNLLHPILYMYSKKIVQFPYCTSRFVLW